MTPSLSTLALRYEHEVFVSFCGEDTRTRFTSHLLAALDRKKICACGEEFNGAELMKAIETSRMAVVVFSKSYATSDRCLVELAKIMECNRVLNQRVFPIFYDVSPSQVREQKGNFEEAATLAGFHLKANRKESEFIEEIVEKILKKLNEESPAALSPRQNDEVARALKGFEGVEEITTDSKTSKVLVKGKAADPRKVCGRKVEKISPLPKPPEENKEENKEQKEEKKEEPPAVITVELKVGMYCEACAQDIQKHIRKIKGVESVSTDVANDQVIVVGVVEPTMLVDYVYKKTKKQASIVKDEEKKEEKKEEEKKEEKKEEEKKEEEKKEEEKKEEEKKEEKKEEEKEEEKKEEEKKEEEKKEEKKEEEKKEEEKKEEEKKEEEKKDGEEGKGGDDKKSDIKKSEYLPSKHLEYLYAYPPQIFSDENPNACSVL